jgi:hypothetical protein
MVSASKSSMNKNAPTIININPKIRDLPKTRRIIPSIKKIAPERR